MVVSILPGPPSPRSRMKMLRLQAEGKTGMRLARGGKGTIKASLPRGRKRRGGGPPILYDDDFNLDHPILMGVLANEEVANVHARINFNRHLRVVEQQCLQQAAFMKYLRGTVVPNFQEVRDSNEGLEKEVNRLKASVELVGKELKSYKTQNETLKTAKEKAEKSNSGLKVELKKLREDLVVRTAKVEAAKKEADDLRVEMEQVQKARNSSVGMGKQAVAALIKKNLARHQAKWEEEKTNLVAIGNNLVKESFDNALDQVSLRNPNLNLDGVSHEYEVLRGRICRLDTEARKLFDVDSGEEVVEWDEEGEYRNE
ncbi:hypothetical protein SESBI_28401 [Sesbania bispinosa]|nr:hypothetical protein SESBI_28401 [Sesbania bispinosa]